jgi:hypothetical protein
MYNRWSCESLGLPCTFYRYNKAYNKNFLSHKIEVTTIVHLTLSQIYNGKNNLLIQYSVQSEDKQQQQQQQQPQPCFNCHGTGKVRTRSVFRNPPVNWVICRACNGIPKKLCSINERHSTYKETIQRHALIDIKRGTLPGTIEYFYCYWERYKLAVVYVLDNHDSKSFMYHPYHSINGSPILSITLVVTSTEARSGFTREIEHLDGSRFLYVHPRPLYDHEMITQTQLVLIKGKGLPILVANKDNNDDDNVIHDINYGDLLIKFAIETQDSDESLY